MLQFNTNLHVEALARRWTRLPGDRDPAVRGEDSAAEHVVCPLAFAIVGLLRSNHQREGLRVGEKEYAQVFTVTVRSTALVELQKADSVLFQD
jgi:hypothetical protein